MRVLRSGSTALLLELDSLADVLDLYPALVEERPDGVVDVVPAARTVLLVTDPAVTDLPAVEQAVRKIKPVRGRRLAGKLVELPVVYDGQDLGEVAAVLRCPPEEVVRRHTRAQWSVAFCGFAPGFGYLTSDLGWQLPRRSTPRPTVPAGSVGLAGEFSGVYPRASPGGWQLIGRTDVRIFDLDRDPAALLRPGTRVRFVAAGRP